QRGVRVSTAIEEAICHALEKDPHMRPASAEAFMTELREALGAEDDGGATGFEKTLASVANYETAETITGQFAESSMTHEDLSLLETQRKAESEAEAQKNEQEDAERQRASEEDNRVTHEVEYAQRSAVEARQRAETEAQQRVREEAARRAAEERAERLALALEEAQSRAEEAGR